MGIFWLLAFGLAWALSVPAALAQHGFPLPYEMPLPMRAMGFAPTIAALIASALNGGVRAWWSRIGTLQAPWPLYGVALVMPLALLSTAFAWSAYSGHAEPKLAALTPDVAMLAALWLVLAAGEELGWRAYALPKLVERHGFWPGASLLGVAWAVWHYPMLLASPYVLSVDQAVYWLGMFTAQIVLANYLISWLMMRSGAVIVPTLFHTMFNVVATLYWAAAIDVAITGALAAVVVLLFLFDRSPRQVPAPSAA